MQRGLLALLLVAVLFTAGYLAMPKRSVAPENSPAAPPQLVERRERGEQSVEIPLPPDEAKSYAADSDASDEVSWRVIPPDPTVIIRGAQSDAQGARFVSIDRVHLATRLVGETIVIPVPQIDRRLSYEVTRRKIQGQVTSIFAQSQKGERLLITLGEKNTFAHVMTDEGSFELVGNTDHGWLVATALMDPHVDPTAMDYVVPHQLQIPEVPSP